MPTAFQPVLCRLRHLRGLPAGGSTRAARCLAVAVAIGLTLACAGSESTGVPSKAHPIVLIAVDGLRADHLGCYGYERDTSPNLDALARESVLFEWAFSQAAEPLPSLVSIVTGLYPTTHGVLDADDPLPEEASTLAEALSSRGYATAAFFAGGPSTAGLGQGLEIFETGGSVGPKELTSAVRAWLEDHASENFLLVVRLPALGAPLVAGPPYREMFAGALEPPSPDFQAWLEAAGAGLLAPEDLAYAKALYDGQIRFLDDWIGEFMADARRLGIDRRATIAVVATHGRRLQEHSAVPNDTLYTPATRVPLLLRLPDGREARSLANIVETVDLMPTLLDLTGTEEPASIQGQSLVPLIQGQGKPPYVAFGESTRDGAQRFVALGGYRLLLSRADDRAELYHLPDDPLELNDLAGEGSEAERLAVLRRHLGAWETMVSTASLDPDGQTVPMDEETLEQLRSLGYIQ